VNNFNAIGRVGKDDAKVRRTGNGEPVTGWSLAVDSGFGDKKQTLWLDCSLWGKRGEAVAPYITAGSQLGVSGELGQREHEGKKYLTLRVAEVTLVGGKGEKRQESKPAPSDDFDDDGPAEFLTQAA
jgi:single-strand DNA-binding protein